MKNATILILISIALIAGCKRKETPNTKSRAKDRQSQNVKTSDANEPSSGTNEPSSGTNEPSSGTNEPSSRTNEPAADSSSNPIQQPPKDPNIARFEKEIAVIDHELEKLNVTYNKQEEKIQSVKELLDTNNNKQVPEEVTKVLNERYAINLRISELKELKMNRIREEEERRISEEIK